MQIRHAQMSDLDRLAAIEAASYPAAEGASRESLTGRLAAYPELFWLLEEEGEVRAFVNGFATDTPDLTDEMYDRPSLYDPAGAWQMIFSVVTAPEWRGLRLGAADPNAGGCPGHGPKGRGADL